jgi:TetR/AcrR family transcriptional regulator
LKNSWWQTDVEGDQVLARRKVKPPKGRAGKPGASTRKKPAKPDAGRPRGNGAKKTILDAALKIFARDGFDGASIPKIARMAKTARPLVHYHFGSKDNLWRQTVAYALDGLMGEAAAIAAASRGLSPLDKLRVLIRALAHSAARYPDHLGLIMSEARSDTERLAWLRANYTDTFMKHLLGLLKQAQDAKEIKKIPLDHLSFILMGATLLYLTLNFTLPKDADMESVADQHAKWVLDVMLDGIAT